MDTVKMVERTNARLPKRKVYDLYVEGVQALEIVVVESSVFVHDSQHYDNVVFSMNVRD